jgi:hypothetical protein
VRLPWHWLDEWPRRVTNIMAEMSKLHCSGHRRRPPTGAPGPTELRRRLDVGSFPVRPRCRSGGGQPAVARLSRPRGAYWASGASRSAARRSRRRTSRWSGSCRRRLLRLCLGAAGTAPIWR